MTVSRCVNANQAFALLQKCLKGLARLPFRNCFIARRIEHDDSIIAHKMRTAKNRGIFSRYNVERPGAFAQLSQCIHTIRNRIMTKALRARINQNRAGLLWKLKLQ